MCAVMESKLEKTFSTTHVPGLKKNSKAAESMFDFIFLLISLSKFANCNFSAEIKANEICRENYNLSSLSKLTAKSGHILPLIGLSDLI